MAPSPGTSGPRGRSFLSRLGAWLRLLVTLPLFLLLLIFAVANRQSVALNLWPFGVAIAAPAFLLTLGSLALGFFAGGLVTWLAASAKRRRLRFERAELQALRLELAGLRKELETRTPQPAPLPPANP
jgi:uncharacterized integral membrane protein